MTNLFVDGFESGTILTSDNPAGAWTGIEFGSPSVQSTVKHHGTHALTFAAEGDVYYTLPSDMSELYARTYLRFTAMPDDVHDKTLMFWVGDTNFLTSVVAISLVNDDDGIVKWQLVYLDNNGWHQGTPLASPLPAVNTWYCLEVYWRRGNGTGQATAWLDGAQIQTVTNLTNTDFYARHIQVGMWNYQGSSSITAYYDCVVASDSYIGPENNIEANNLTVDNILTIKTPESGNYINIQTIMVPDTSHPNVSNPILSINEGSWFKKDFYCEGFVGCDSRMSATGGGAIQLGNRLTGIDDPPRIILSNATDSEGDGATATANVSTGKVVSFNITNVGNGYTSPPKVIIMSFVDEQGVVHGEGAQAYIDSADIVNHQITAIKVYQQGEGYDVTPTVHIIRGKFDTLYITKSDIENRFEDVVTRDNIESGMCGHVKLDTLFASHVKSFTGSDYMFGLTNMPRNGANNKVLTARGNGNEPEWADASIPWDNVPGPIYPELNDTYSLGSGLKRWLSITVNAAYFNTINSITGITYISATGHLASVTANANIITDGEFGIALIPRLTLAKLPTGTNGYFLKGQGATDPVYTALVEADVPNLGASKITTGSFDPARIPNLSASKITSDTVAEARLPHQYTSDVQFGNANYNINIEPTNQKIWFGNRSNSWDTKLIRYGPGALAVNDVDGYMGTFRASNLYADHIYSQSEGPIYFMNLIGSHLIPNASGLSLGSGDNPWAGINLEQGVGKGLFQGPYYAVQSFYRTFQQFNCTMTSQMPEKFTPRYYGDSNAQMGFWRVDAARAGLEYRYYNSGTSGAEVQWDSFTQIFELTTDGRLNLPVIGAYGGLRIGGDAHLFRAADGVIQINNSSGQAGTLNASNIKTDHLMALTGSGPIYAFHDFCPNTAPTWNGNYWAGGMGLGNSTNFWNYIDSAYYYAKYTTFIAFDALDDLSIIKNSTVTKIGEINVVDMDSLPHLKASDPTRPDSVDIGKVHGFLIGCAKQTALKLDEIEAKTATILDETEAREKLEQEVRELREIVNKLSTKFA